LMRRGQFEAKPEAGAFADAPILQTAAA